MYSTMCKTLNLEFAIKFLAEYFFIYKVPNIDIFVNDVLEAIPQEWCEVLLSLTLYELRKVPFGYFEDSWPQSLLCFLKDANSFAEYRYQYQLEKDMVAVDIKIPDFIRHKTPIKKLHEIQHMATIVHKLSETYGCGIVVDIGSGLGYLGQIIHYNFGLMTIEFESDLSKSLNAKQRASLGACQGNIHHVHQKIENTLECQNILRKAIEDTYMNKVPCTCGEHGLSLSERKDRGGVIMVGLHSCGDLMQSMMKLFCQIPEIKVFLCAGCCYHKLNLSDFPMSDIGKKAVSEVQQEHITWKVSTTGLRLGCQTTRDSWAKQSDEDFVYREKCLAYRAIMQIFIRKENLVWKRPKRHLMKKDLGSFEDFALCCLGTIPLDGSTQAECLNKLNALFEEKKHLFRYIRILNLLQILLQPIWESVIIGDRIAYFQQKAIQSDILVLCEESVTPRNLMLCGIK